MSWNSHFELGALNGYLSHNLLFLDSADYFKQLEWDVIVRSITQKFYFDNSSHLVALPIAPKTLVEMEDEFDSVEFFFKKIPQNLNQSLQQAFSHLNSALNVSALVKSLEKGSVLTLLELNDLAKDIENFEDICQYLLQWSKLNQYSPAKDHLQKIQRSFLRPLRKFVTPQGDIHYQNHPLLQEKYQTLKNLEQNIRNILKKIVLDPLYSADLQYNEFDIINEQYVLAIKADNYKGHHGQIIARSNKGHTFFVEPPPLRPLSNQRMTLLAQIEALINKICISFCQQLIPYSEDLKMLRNFYLQVDLLLAKALYCFEKNLVRPSLSAEPTLNIQNLFHPLIINPVKNDLSLTLEQKGLIISGPNTGGKTATLKALALTHLFLHFGLFVPASSATLHPFLNIVYLGNDEQNLPQGLSSFSSEVKNYMTLLRNLESTNLIIIDEIFNSTSSEEASALAMALFKEIHRLSTSKIIVSTHHQMLKTLMHQDKDYLSAHMGIDLDREGPTYQLITGIPGSSMALTIFKKLSENFISGEKIVAVAKTVIDQKLVHYEALLKDVSNNKASLEKLILENKSLHENLLNQKNAMEGLLKLKMQEEIEKFKKELKALVQEAETYYENVKRDQAENKLITPKQLRTKLFSYKSQLEKKEKALFIDEKFKEEKIYQQIHPEEVLINHEYFCLLIQQKVTVKSLNLAKGNAFVQYKGKKLTCPINTLMKLDSSQSTIGKQPPKISIHFSHDEEDYTSLTHDVRGQRLEEFQHFIEKFLSRLLTGNIPYLTIIHGHGGGILKNWLREYIESFPDLLWERTGAEQSNDGGTTIKLRD